jgi:hypothetical protein
MINVHRLINGVFMGSVLIALGLYPRLLQTLAEAVVAFSNQFPNGFPLASLSIMLFKQRRWFATIGAALIVLSFAAYLTHP